MMQSRLGAAWFISSVLISSALASRIDHGLVEWLRSQKGGFFNRKQEIRHEIPGDSASHLGIFAMERIEEGEIIAQIPWEIIIQDEDYEDGFGEQHVLSCSTVWKLAREMKLGAKSTYAPYVQYLQSLERGQLPSAWSDHGKNLFLDVLGGEDNPELIMESFDYLHDIWYEICGGSKKDETSANAAMLVQQRGTNDGMMIPIYDLYTHRNGYWYNIETQVNEGKNVQILASRPIYAGEQIHNSYNGCDNCARQDDDNGTPEIFRDHGITEKMPQFWAIPRGKTEIEVERDDKVEITTILHGDFEFTLNDDGAGGIVVALWDFSDDWMFAVAEAQFQREIRRLNRMKNIDWDLGWEHYDIPRNEWDAIWAFHQTYVKALTHALIALDGDVPASDESLGRLEHHYDDFNTDIDTINYNEPTCESSEFIDFQNYEVFEEHKTNYQTMLWSRRAEDEDVCLHLDNVLQICSSYRPHYHEFFVHFPARYIETVKRVIFLGSGDAMLLHEILKYPSLELVVGLEIDQQVTRTSSKHFHTQPHYDDERVQWWYGDATKTLPLLPREYWGSFDLVLVDLSETVVSATVTGLHDILDVISMLLKPEGILLENELYIEKLSNHFDHTIQIFYGSPKVCTQVLTMSSNEVDFLRSPTFDHSLENYLVKPLENSQDRFKYIHDYEMTSVKEQGKCHDSDGDCNITTEQGRKAGILYLLEAEDTSIPLSSESLEERMYSVLRNDGFKPVSTPSKDDDVVVIVMKEGYVVARMWPELDYCGFDINLWGGFDKSNKVYSSLAKTVGSTSLSSYRIVVGGMHGSSTWEKDQEVIGVQVSQKRDCKEDDLSDRDDVDQETYGIALSETIDLAGAGGLVVAIVCGIESEAECPSLQFAKSHPSVEKVVTLWACADDSEDVDTNPRHAAKMYECEKHTMNHIEATVISKHQKLDMIVFDSSTTLSMIQVLSSILSVPSNGRNWLEEQYAFLAPSHGKDGRKQRFMNMYRTQRHPAPISHATLTMEGRETFLELEIMWGGDDNAVEKLITLEYQIRQRLPKIGIDLRRITGGKEHAKYDLRHEQESFSRDDYDLQPVQEQRSQQRALGRQTIFQLELEDTTAIPSLDDLADYMAKALEELKYSPSRFEKYSDVGDGGLVVAIFKEGSAILTWDGKDHVDINMFAFDQSKKVADALLNAFVRLSQDRLELALRDDQPRGIGGVVNFSGETGKVVKTLPKNAQKKVTGPTEGLEVFTTFRRNQKNGENSA